MHRTVQGHESSRPAKRKSTMVRGSDSGFFHTNGLGGRHRHVAMLLRGAPLSPRWCTPWGTPLAGKGTDAVTATHFDEARTDPHHHCWCSANVPRRASSKEKSTAASVFVEVVPSSFVPLWRAAAVRLRRELLRPQAGQPRLNLQPHSNASPPEKATPPAPRYPAAAKVSSPHARSTHWRGPSARTNRSCGHGLPNPDAWTRRSCR
jgi:hypothetical protein